MLVTAVVFVAASVAERFNRTLKEKMYRYFTAKHTRRYVDVLHDLVHAYNNTYHRSIGTAPVDVTPDNGDAMRERLYPVHTKLLD